MSGRIASIVRAVLGAALCLALACCLWQVAARTIFHQELPSVLGYSLLAVASGSMEPALSAGDLVVVHREDGYRVGDVVAFWDEGSLTTHRLVAEAPEGFATKGDANNVQDGRPVAAGQIAGRVVLAVPFVGAAALFLRTPAGLALLAVLGLLLVFWPDAHARARRRGEECAA